MTRVGLGPVLALSLFFLCGAASRCRAADNCQLTVVAKDEGTESKFKADWNLWQNDQWRLETSLSLPDPPSSDTPESIDLMLSFFDEDWRWTATAGADRDNAGTDWHLRIRGAFDRRPWSLAVTGYREGGDLGLEGYLARRFGPWRIKLWQDVARVDGPSDYQRYSSELVVTWWEGGKLYNLYLGGYSRQGADRAEDVSKYYAEAGWSLRLPASWTLSGGCKWNWEVGSSSSQTGNRLSLNLVRRAPLGIKINASYSRAETDFEDEAKPDEMEDLWRAGLTFLGTAEPFYWRAGAAVELNPAEPAPEAWVFGVLGWHQKSWRVELGLTPDGEYAATSRHGYWVSVKYEF